MSGQKPKRKRPSAAEMDERVEIPLPPEKVVEGVLHAGPHPADAKKEPARKRKPST